MELPIRKWGVYALYALLAAVGSLTAISAQEASSNSQNTGPKTNTVLIRTYNIRKIYSHRLGYRIDVINYQGKVRTIYVKNSWFNNPEVSNPQSDRFEVQATMNLTPIGLPSNYLTLKYQDKKLVMVAIHVEEASYDNNGIWYAIPATSNIDEKFAVQSVQFSDPAPVPAGKMPQPKAAKATTEKPQN